MEIALLIFNVEIDVVFADNDAVLHVRQTASALIFAAQIKSYRDRPPTECVV